MSCLFCKPFTSCVFPRNSFFLVPTNSSALSLSYPFQLTWNYLPNTLWHQGQVLPLQGNQPGPLHWAPLFETPASKMTVQQYSRSVSIKLKFLLQQNLNDCCQTWQMCSGHTDFHDIRSTLPIWIHLRVTITSSTVIPHLKPKVFATLSTQPSISLLYGSILLPAKKR